MKGAIFQVYRLQEYRTVKTLLYCACENAKDLKVDIYYFLRFSEVRRAVFGWNLVEIRLCKVVSYIFIFISTYRLKRFT